MGTEDLKENKSMLPTSSKLPQGFVEDILFENSTGNSRRYDELIKILSDTGSSDELLLRYIQGFRSCVLKLSKAHEHLVGSVLRLNWHERSDVLSGMYIAFLSDLLTAHTGYLQAALRMLVTNFAPSLLQVNENKDATVEFYKPKFDNVHKALQNMLAMIPLSSTAFIEASTKLFPYHGKPNIILECFVQNLLRVTTYSPSIRSNILEIIMENVMKIDVEIPKHALENAADECESVQFDVEMDEVSARTNEDAEKLDKLLVLLCGYLRGLCYPNGKGIDWNVASLLNREIAGCFEKFLLPTHASSYVQFVIFYVCSFNEIFSNYFLETAWKAIQNPTLPSVFRQSAAAYMGSLVARARYISVEKVKHILVLMRDWIHRYIGLQDGGNIEADLYRHAAFYSVCQSMIYIFLFRHGSILCESDGNLFCQSLNFERMITSRLNPLKFCLKTVVDMFARITRMHEIVFCYTIIDRNSRCQLPVARGRNEIRDVSRFQNILDTFFPFDPCLLPLLSKLVVPFYQEWEESNMAASDQVAYDSEEEVYNSTIRHARERETSWQFMACSPIFDACISPGFQMASSLRSNEP